MLCRFMRQAALQLFKDTWNKSFHFPTNNLGC